MPRNIALIAINTELSELKNNDNYANNNTDKYSSHNKCLSLLDKYRDYLTVVCLNCNCNQNIGNKLFVKYNALEKDYKNLFKDIDNSSLKSFNEHTNGCNDHINFDVDNELDSITDTLIEFDCQEEKCSLLNTNHKTCSIDGWDQFVFNPPVIDSETIQSAKSRQQFLCETESASNKTDAKRSAGETPILKKSNTECIKNVENSKQTKTECEKNLDSVSTNEKKLKFNSHFIETETKESQTDNAYISVLHSKKIKTTNPSQQVVVGYRCKWPNCDFINRYFSRSYEHVCITHTGVRPHKCDKCEKFFFTQKEIKNHQLDHKKNNTGISVKQNKTNTSLKAKQKTTKTDLSAKPNNIAVKHIGPKSMPQNDSDGKTVFNDLIIGTDTWEKPDKKFISALLSRTESGVSMLVGFRCTFPKCNFAHKVRKCVTLHVDKMHSTNIDKQKPQLITSQQSGGDVNGNIDIRFNDIITFNDHIIGIDTNEMIPFPNEKISALISSKLNNCPLIGYRCRWPDCDYINRKLSCIQTHIIESHTGLHMLNDCDNYV